MKRLMSLGTVFLLTLVSTPLLAEQPMVLMSDDIAHGETLKEEQVFKGFGCAGENVSPALKWKNPPKGTKSFALTVYDPDAPTGSGWWHWVIFDLPSGLRQLNKNAGDPRSGIAPDGSVQTKTDYGVPGFGGACPPKGHGPHRYKFTLYALDIPKLKVNKDATAALVGFMINSHKLAETTIEAVYQR